MKGDSSGAQPDATTRAWARKGHRSKAPSDDEVALDHEVVERLKSWCYV